LSFRRFWNWVLTLIYLKFKALTYSSFNRNQIAEVLFLIKTIFRKSEGSSALSNACKARTWCRFQFFSFLRLEALSVGLAFFSWTIRKQLCTWNVASDCATYIRYFLNLRMWSLMILLCSLSEMSVIFFVEKKKKYKMMCWKKQEVCMKN
jgi:hypothetical protein